MRKVVPFIVIPIVIAVAVFLALRRHAETEAERGIYTGTVEAEESRVGSTVGGRIIDTLVREGETVHKGQKLVVFDSEELSASLKAAEDAEQQARDRLSDLEAGARPEEIARAEAAVAAAASEVEKLRRGSRPEEIAAARAAAQQAREHLALAKAGPRKEEIDQARAAYDAAAADSKLADQSLGRIESLYKEGAVAAQTLDEAKARSETAAANEDRAKRKLDELLAGTRKEDIRAAEQAVKQAEANLRLVQKGPRVEDIRAAEANLAQAEATLAELRAGTRPYQIEQARAAVKQAHSNVEQIKARTRERAVYAPRNGQLQALNIQPGDIVTPGQSVATIIDPNDLYVKIYIPEGELGGLTVGTKLQAVTDSGIHTTGVVEQIPARAEFTPRNVQTKDERELQVYAVKMRLANPNNRLRAGMSVDVSLPVK